MHQSLEVLLTSELRMLYSFQCMTVECACFVPLCVCGEFLTTPFNLVVQWMVVGCVSPSVHASGGVDLTLYEWTPLLEPQICKLT